MSGPFVGLKRFPSRLPAAPGAESRPSFLQCDAGLSVTQGSTSRGFILSSHPVCCAHARRCSAVSAFSGEGERIEGFETQREAQSEYGHTTNVQEDALLKRARAASPHHPRLISTRMLSGSEGKMKKFNIRKVLDGLTAVSSPSPSAQLGTKENELIPETLQSEHFQLCKTVRHGFPYQPSSMAFDPVQKILAIGTQSGALRLYPFHDENEKCVWSVTGAEGT
ncbi:hypothetical protein DNTS_001986 [Danionella cerebrum]|uniref:Uncharacterized protein n=1 Tax=Danionella cerebrum TaxID=2873325 RepID=A0A553RAH5_9TELE|nr:hypothetical protein DNTS_001986 [Danionella translucida]